jgi:hypothetical protein
MGVRARVSVALRTSIATRRLCMTCVGGVPVGVASDPGVGLLVLKLRKVGLSVPTHTSLGRRRRQLVRLPRRAPGEPLPVGGGHRHQSLLGKVRGKSDVMVGPNGARGGSYL